MRTPFLGPMNVSRSLNLADNRLINLFVEVVDTKDGRDVGALYSTPGTVLQATVGQGPIRGLHTVAEYCYAVSGNKVYQLDSDFNETQLGTINTSEGPVGMVDNGDDGSQVLIVDGQAGFVYNITSTAFTQITSAAFPTAPATVAYQDGLALVNDEGTNSVSQSGLMDFLSWPSTALETIDSQPGNLQRVFNNRREMWMFKDQVTEIYINAGSTPFSFQLLTGVFIQKGCVAPYSVARVGQNIAWLGKDEQGQGIVYLASGYSSINRISTHGLEKIIQGYSVMSDAIGYGYQKEGHFFYVLTFPTGNQTWVYDLTSSIALGYPVWNQWARFDNGNFTRHSGNCYAFFDGKNLVGSHQTGRIYSLDLDVFTDDNEAKKWVRSWRAFPTGSPPTQARFEGLRMVMQTGIGVTSGANPQIALRWSDDGGHTYSNEKLCAMGPVGHTSQEVMWHRLGQTRRATGLDRIFEVSGDAACPAYLIGADIEVKKV